MMDAVDSAHAGKVSVKMCVGAGFSPPMAAPKGRRYTGGNSGSPTLNAKGELLQEMGLPVRFQ